MKQVLIFWILFSVVFGISGMGMRIVVTINPYYLVLNELAGDLADIHLLIGPGQNPHLFSPTIQDARALNQADWIIANGYGLESFLMNLFEDLGSKGKQVTYAGMLIPETQLFAKYSTDYSYPDSPHSKDHDHGPINPHVWVDPVFMAEYIVPEFADHLSKMIPQSAPLILERAKAIIEALEEFTIVADAFFSPYQGNTIVMSHPSFTYFFRRFGIDDAAVFLGESTEPTIEDIRRIIRTIREQKVLAIFGELHISPKSLETIVQETGMQSPRQLNTLGWETETIAELFETNFQIMKCQIQ